MKMHRSFRLFWTLNLLFLAQWVLLAFGVHSRSTWILENLLVAAFAVPVILGYRRGVLSDLSYIMIFVFVSLHNLGAHYTYSLVPYDRWLDQAFGFTLKSLFGWERNHYDRLLHFLFGLLFFDPIREALVWRVRLNPVRSAIGSILIIIAWSSLYELMEWATAVLMSEGAGPEFIGTQGDPWDAQADQALALLGSVIAACVLPLVIRERKKSH